MTYHIGQVIPLHYSRRPLGRGMSPAWFILQVMAQQELPLSAWLLRNGALDCWHPTEKAWKPLRQGRKVAYFRPIAPGYLFALVDKEPQWDIIKERQPKAFRRVVSHNGEPIPIPESVLMQMQQVPQRIATIQEQIRLAKTVRVGERATYRQTPNLEWTVEVTEIHEGIAHFVMPLLGGAKGKAPVDSLERIHTYGEQR